MPTLTPPVRAGLRASLLVGAVLAIIQLSGAVQPVELLAAGRDGQGGDVMVRDFGPGAIREGIPFDGQYLYVTARLLPDLDAVSEEIHESSYRLVRILHPLLASPGGEGVPIIVLLELWGVVGVGLLTGALADLFTRYGHPIGLANAAIAACVLPVILTTSEALAFGLAMVGLALVDRDRLVSATALLALSGLARESALTIALVAGMLLAMRGQRQKGALVVGAAAAPTVAWWAYVQSITESSRVPLEPLGILRIFDRWPVDIAASVVVIVLLVVAVVTWWDVLPLRLVALAFVLWLPLYEGVAFKAVGVPRLSVPAVALGLAGAARHLRLSRARSDGVVIST